jgi:hypothetical protein
MNRTKRLKGTCGECGGPIEFPAELIGTMTTCPRCRKQTELMLTAPPEEPLVPRRIIIWSAVAIVILILGLIVTVVGSKHFENLAARQRDRSAAAPGGKDAGAAAGFEISAISLEKGPGNSETYVVGTVANISRGRRAGVTIEFDLLDAGGRQVEVARAFRPVLEPGAKWEVKVPVAADSKAVSARLAFVHEGP